MHSLMMILSLCGFIFFASATSDLPYLVSDLRYVGNLGGHEVEFNGTVQEIYAQMQKLYPGFEPPTFPKQTQDQRLQPRATQAKDGTICGFNILGGIKGQSWRQGYTSQAEEGAFYLKSLGQGSCYVNGHSCVRLSCYGNTGIWLCNDRTDQIHPNCNYLGGYAIDIIQKCGEHVFTPWTDGWVLGQEFDSDRYNIIVKWEEDC